jgi:hypothetical protein
MEVGKGNVRLQSRVIFSEERKLFIYNLFFERK